MHSKTKQNNNNKTGLIFWEKNIDQHKKTNKLFKLRLQLIAISTPFLQNIPKSPHWSDLIRFQMQTFITLKFLKLKPACRSG